MTHKTDVTVSYTHENSRIPFDKSFRSFHPPSKFTLFKFACDTTFAVISLPIILLASIVLIVVNPVLNPGPLFFSQTRMGKNGRQFKMIKFRTMSVAKDEVRAPDAPLEVGRITPFASFLRRFRIDEIPNFLNVLAGEMSVIGPRPDAWWHAQQFSTEILYYSRRFEVRPGITGLAQVRGGYAESVRAVSRKARYDYFYVRNSSIRMELYVLIQTLSVLRTGFGAK